MPIKLPSFRQRRDTYPPDLWTQCPSCQEMLFNKQLEKVLRVCSNCGHHFRLSAAARLDLLLDAGHRSRSAIPACRASTRSASSTSRPTPTGSRAAQATTGLRDAAVWGFGAIGGRPVAICVMDFSFMGGSMGSVVGEKVVRSTEAALARRIPLVIVSASGGARMQEGTLSLMQLVKTVAGDRAAAPGRRAPDLGDERSDDRRRLRLVRGPGRREHRRAERPDRLRRRAGQRRARSRASCRKASSARSSCSTTASSTGSSIARSCAMSWSSWSA